MKSNSSAELRQTTLDGKAGRSLRKDGHVDIMCPESEKMKFGRNDLHSRLEIRQLNI